MKYNGFLSVTSFFLTIIFSKEKKSYFVTLFWQLWIQVLKLMLASLYFTWSANVYQIYIMFAELDWRPVSFLIFSWLFWLEIYHFYWFRESIVFSFHWLYCFLFSIFYLSDLYYFLCSVHFQFILLSCFLRGKLSSVIWDHDFVLL